MSSRATPSRGATIAALVAVYVLWGATTPAIKIAVEHFPPFAMACTRFAVAGSVLWLFVRARGVPLPAAGLWRGALYSGTLLLVLANAVFAWTLQTLPAGIGSLFFALTPIWNVLIGIVWYRERPSLQVFAGIALGLGGMLYLIAPSPGQTLPLVATSLAIFTSIAWSAGSMIQRRYAGVDVVQMSAMQMLVAAAELAIVAAASGEHVTLAMYTVRETAAILYLALFGSIIAFSAYVWVTRTLSTALASTNSYVNPIVAIALATAFMHERISMRELLASAIVLAGVALMLLPSRDNVTRAVPAAE